MLWQFVIVGGVGLIVGFFAGLWVADDAEPEPRNLQIEDGTDRPSRYSNAGDH